LEGWPRREAFARGYFDIGLESYRAGYGTLLHLDPTWFLACGPAKRPERPYFAELCPIDWPFRLYTRFEEWDAFLLGVYAEGLTGMALDRAKEVMARVTGLVPDQAALDNLYSTRAA
jgi:hypothetical protein